jgi:hypothetical protein
VRPAAPTGDVRCRFRNSGAEWSGGLAARHGADVHALAVASVDAEDLDRLVVCWTEPVGQPGVDLRHLAEAHRDVLLAENHRSRKRRKRGPTSARTSGIADASASTD